VRRENRYKEEGKRDEEEREGEEWKKRSREEREFNGGEKRTCAVGIFYYFRLCVAAQQAYEIASVTVNGVNPVGEGAQ